ncbi:hypothetical protein ACFQ0B_50025 [Nonomuraea thailandensis]
MEDAAQTGGVPRTRTAPACATTRWKLPGSPATRSSARSRPVHPAARRSRPAAVTGQGPITATRVGPARAQTGACVPNAPTRHGRPEG